MLRLTLALSGIVGLGSANAFGGIEILAGSGWAGSQGGSYTPYQDGDGGEFTVLNNSGSVASSFTPAGYSSEALYTLGTNDNPTGSLAGLTGFETFCVEGGTNEVYFTPGAVYNYTLSENVVGGRTLVLTAGAAWLYSEFATGGLSSYGYDYTPANRTADAGLLQNAIWYLLGETGSGNALSAAAATQLGGLGIAQESVVTYGNDFGVSVMNLTDGNGNSAQNQLYYSPVPDSGTTILLMGLSLMATAFLARHRRAHQA